MEELDKHGGKAHTSDAKMTKLKDDIGKMALAPHSKKKICYYYDSESKHHFRLFI